MNSSLNRAGAAASAADEHPQLSAANSRAGLVLFFIYLVLYAGFVGVAAFAPQAMAAPALAGINLAICYGMGLIFAAFLVAALYMLACARNARRFTAAASEDRR
jgi:uncharacterized membrane protein (DUF485 family)